MPRDATIAPVRLDAIAFGLNELAERLDDCDLLLDDEIREIRKQLLALEGEVDEVLADLGADTFADGFTETASNHWKEIQAAALAR